MKMGVVSLLLLIFLSGCTLLRPIVVEPNIVVVINNTRTVSGDNGNAQQSRSINLPVCYLEKCANVVDSICASKALTLMKKKQSPVWKLLVKKPQAIITFAPRGYYSTSTRIVPLAKIASKWAEIGCVEDPNLPDDTASAARHRECNRNMSRWITQINEGSVVNLGADMDFRRTCQRDSF